MLILSCVALFVGAGALFAEIVKAEKEEAKEILAMCEKARSLTDHSLFLVNWKG